MSEHLGAADLIRLLHSIVECHGNVPVLFDTEAGKFDYHMATVDRAYLETEPEVHVALHTDGHIRHDFELQSLLQDFYDLVSSAGPLAWSTGQYIENAHEWEKKAVGLLERARSMGVS